MKRIISLLLLLAMAVIALSSCGLDYIQAASSYIDQHPIDKGRTPITLNFFIPSGGEMSEQAVSAMQDKFNQIIESKYSTHVEFVILSEAEYGAALDSKIEKSNIYSGTYQTDTKGPDILGTDGVTVFPGVSKYQLDIFVTTSYQKFNEYVGKSYIKDITDYVENNTRNLSGRKDTNKLNGVNYPKISKVIFNNAYYYSVEYENDTESTVKSELKQYYGIPSTYPIGSYDYLIVDKTAANKYYTKDYFIEDATIAGGNDTVNKGKDLLKSELLTAGISQSEIDSEYIISLPSASYEARLPYQESGKYYISILKKPTATYEEICSAMMCINQRTVDTERAFEVIYELNTNPLLHTILQYGAQDTNYRYDVSTQTISLISGAPAYNMNIRYTGNCFTILPCVNAGANSGVKNFTDITYLSTQNLDAKVNNIAIHKTNILRKNIEKLLIGDTSLYTNDVPVESYLYYDKEGSLSIGGETKNVVIRHIMYYTVQSFLKISPEGTESFIYKKVPTSYTYSVIYREDVAETTIDRTVYSLSMNCTTGDYTISYEYHDDDGNVINSISSVIKKFPVTGTAKIVFTSAVDEETVYSYSKDITAGDITDLYALKFTKADDIIKVNGVDMEYSTLNSQTCSDFAVSASTALLDAMSGISAILGQSEDNLKLYDLGFTKLR